jgi:hypothetical protein
VNALFNAENLAQQPYTERAALLVIAIVIKNKA